MIRTKGPAWEFIDMVEYCGMTTKTIIQSSFALFLFESVKHFAHNLKETCCQITADFQ